MPAKLGRYGTSCFKGNDRFPVEKPSATQNAEWYVPEDRKVKKSGGFISKVDRFKDPMAEQCNTTNADFFVPKGVGSGSSRSVKLRPGSRFAKEAKPATAEAELYTPRSFVDDTLKKRTGKNAFGRGDRFRDSFTGKGAVSANVEPYVPETFADIAIKKARRSHTPEFGKGRAQERFKYQASSTTNAEFFSAPSSVEIKGGFKGKWHTGGERFAKQRRPPSSDADFFIPNGCGTRGANVPRMRSGSPRFNNEIQSATQDAEFYMPERKKSACPAAANFRDSSPRFKDAPKSTAKSDYYEQPSFVDLILSK